MKISFGFLTWAALLVCETFGADVMSKIFHSSRGMSLNHDSADDNLGVYQVMSNVLLQVGQLNEKVDQMSQTVSQLTQTVDQLSRDDNQENSRKGTVR